MRKSALNLLLGVVHADRQNVAQTNMLVSEEVRSHHRPFSSLSRSPHLFHPQGIVTLSDFGLTQALTDVVGKTAIIALSTSVIRWHAPELIEGASPTMASDVFAFGLTVLELLTMKPPYSNWRRDISVVLDLMQGVLPPRPEEPEAVPWMSDGLWETLNACWKRNQGERLSAKELSPCLERASELLTR